MAANPERQEVSLAVVDKVYTLKFTTAASIKLEKRLGKKTGQIMGDISQFGVEAMRDVLWAMLQKHHGSEFPESDKGLDAVSDLIDDAGGPIGITKVIAEAVGVKNEKDAQEAKDGPNPPAAQAGTGGASTLTLAASA